jgi:hypothetical protein
MDRSHTSEATKEVSRWSIDSLRIAIPRWRSIVVLLIFGILSIIMTWPLTAQLGTHIPSEGQDHLVHLWTYWWLKKALLTGQNPFYTTLLYYPNGVSLTTHNIAWLNFAFWLPMQALIGDITAATVMYLVVFTLNGFAMYLLAYEWIRSTPAAFISGLIYGFWPYVVSPGGHVNMIVLFWLPLCLLFLKRTFDDKRPRDAALSGVFLAIGGITRWQLLILSSFIIGLYIVYRLARDASCRTKKIAGQLVIVALVAFIIMAPFAFPVVLDQISRTDTEALLLGDPAESQSNLLGYIIPSTALTFWGKLTNYLPENLQVQKNEMAFIGFTVMALATFGSLSNWRKARFWILAALLYFFLALGSQLKIGNQIFPQVPMPYRLIEDIFLIQVIREVHRFNAVLGLPLAMLAGLGIAALLDRPGIARRAPFVVGLISVVILMEYALVPYGSRNVTIPEWYETLAQEPGEFGVLDLPLDSRDHDKIYMLYQRTHGKPLVIGHVSRLPQEAFGFLDSTPFLRGLRPNSVMDPLLFDVSHQLQALADANVRYLILHKNRVKAEDVTEWRNWLVFDAYYEDEELLVFQTDPQLGRDFELTQELTEDIGIIGTRYWPDNLNPGGFLQVDASWGAKSQPNDDYDVCVQFVDEQGSVAQDQCGPLAPSWPTSRWAASEVVRDHYIMHLDPELSPGIYSVQLALFEPSDGAATGRPAKLGQLIIDDSLEEAGDGGEPDHVLDAHWGDLFDILGYDLADSADKLSITFYWQAAQPTDISYKVFVHLIDEVTGSVVTQADYIPRNWTYPTNMWQPGEIIRDSVQLPLENVPPGTYRLQFGMYDPDTSQRLEVFSSEGVHYPNDAVHLEIFQQN